jgi:polar amino acid transport system substrate-binding protein
MKTLLRFLISMFLGANALGAQKLTLYTEVAPPYQYENAKGVLTGFTVEVVREIQKRVGNTDPISLVPWVRGYNEALTKPNVVLFAMDRSLERNALFHWVGPVGESDYWFFVRASSPILRNLEEAKKLSLIGVYKEDSRDQALTRLGFKNLDRSVDQTVILKKLADGRVDALVDSREDMLQLTKMLGMDMKNFRAALDFQKTQSYLAFSKATPAPVVDAWKKAMDAVKRDGTFERLYHKYFPGMPLPGPAVEPF